MMLPLETDSPAAGRTRYTVISSIGLMPRHNTRNFYNANHRKQATKRLKESTSSSGNGSLGRAKRSRAGSVGQHREWMGAYDYSFKMLSELNYSLIVTEYILFKRQIKL